MNENSYPYDQSQASRYTFVSIGKKRIIKQVVFAHTGIQNIVNVGFGDLMSDGSIYDKANSNNGDIIKVLTTIVHILKDFTTKFPDVEIFFSGSTPERTKLYTRILRSYYSSFSKEFNINALIRKGDHYTKVPFDPTIDPKFQGFIIKRIH